MKLTLHIEVEDNATNKDIADALMDATIQARSAVALQGVPEPGVSYLLGIGKSCHKLKSAVFSRFKSLGWRVREHRVEGHLVDCFVEAPKEDDMPYALQVLGDDYTGYGDTERKYEHCQMIVAWANRGD
jgi:hypothetical protein